MVMSCCAYNCTNRHGKLTEDGKKLTFHRFPLHNPVLLMKWIIAVKRKDWRPTKTTVLCGEHFTQADYRTSKCHVLKLCAVPSVFRFPNHLQRGKKKHALRNDQTPLPEKDVENSLKVDLNKVADSNQFAKSTENPKPTVDEKLTITISPTKVPNQFIMSRENPTPADKKLTITISQTKESDEFAMATESPTPTVNQKLANPIDPTLVHLRKKVKILQDRLRRRDKKIKDLKSMLLKAHNCSDKKIKDIFGEDSNPETCSPT